ncbi:hypothetical protein Tco_0850864 [Tanacetum coccineum]
MGVSVGVRTKERGKGGKVESREMGRQIGGIDRKCLMWVNGEKWGRVGGGGRVLWAYGHEYRSRVREDRVATGRSALRRLLSYVVYNSSSRFFRFGK